MDSTSFNTYQPYVNPFGDTKQRNETVDTITTYFQLVPCGHACNNHFVKEWYRNKQYHICQRCKDEISNVFCRYIFDISHAPKDSQEIPIETAMHLSHPSADSDIYLQEKDDISKERNSPASNGNLISVEDNFHEATIREIEELMQSFDWQEGEYIKQLVEKAIANFRDQNFHRAKTIILNIMTINHYDLILKEIINRLLILLPAQTTKRKFSAFSAFHTEYGQNPASPKSQTPLSEPPRKVQKLESKVPSFKIPDILSFQPFPSSPADFYSLNSSSIPSDSHKEVDSISDQKNKIQEVFPSTTPQSIYKSTPPLDDSKTTKKKIVLTPEVKAKAEELLSLKISPKLVAKELNVKWETLRKALRQGRIKKPQT